MSFIDLDRNLAFIHNPKTSAIVEITWRHESAHILVCAAHDSAAELRRRFPVYWNPARKVCFVRNPFARWVSFYHWYGFDGGDHGYMQGGGNGPFYANFREWLLNREVWLPHLATAQQWPMLCDEGQRIIVDHVARCEQLQEEFNLMCGWSGFPVQTLPAKPARRNYLDFYDDEMRAIVERISAIDLRLFGYKFGDAG